MGSKKILVYGGFVIEAGVMTGTTTLTSETFLIENGDNFGLQLRWTGTPIGVFNLNISNDQINWDALTFTSPSLIQPNGGPGGYSISINQLPWKYFQFQYTNTSGVGVLNVTMEGKDLN
jgi:hypothetical protein